MKKFRIEVTRTDTYEIEVDETVWDEKTLRDWSKMFSLASDQREFAEILAVSIAESDGNFPIEGFGTVTSLHKDGTLCYMREVPTQGLLVKNLGSDYPECDTEEYNFETKQYESCD